MDLNQLKAISQAQITTLEKFGDSAELFRAQVVGKILEDDNWVNELSLNEVVEVLEALGFKSDAAREQAQQLKRNH